MESEWSCICVLGVSIVTTILVIYFGIDPTVWYLLF